MNPAHFSPRKTLQRLLAMRGLQHIAFWGLSYYILVFHFSVSSPLSGIDFVYTALFHLALFPVVYLNLAVNFPIFFQKSRYFRFTLGLAALLGLGLLLHDFIYNYLLEWLAPGYYIISYSDYWELSKIFFVYLAASSLLKLSKSWFVLVQSQEELAQVEREKAELELHQLKAQLNPHFLFNSLNSIYSLALDGSPQTAETVLKLSGMMRYVLYEANAEQVPLEKEIQFMEHYLDMQRMRMQRPETVQFRLEGEVNGQQIAPLLFAPLLENSFKHGVQGARSGSFVEIAMQVGVGGIRFHIRNNLGKSDSPGNSEAGGIGLENLRKRLELLYPDRHQLEITEEGGSFSVDLGIEA